MKLSSILMATGGTMLGVVIIGISAILIFKEPVSAILLIPLILMFSGLLISVFWEDREFL